MPGLQVGARFEYFDQTQLRSGTHVVDRGSLTFPNDDEVQQDTLNRNTWLDLNYVFNRSWALSLSVPYYDRFHTTIAEGDTAISTSDARGIGDVRLLGRWQDVTPRRSIGVQFGLKLPTGRFDQNFAAGPQAGELLDRGLQLGTGTTDLSVGASWFARPAVRIGCFAQTTVTLPLDSRQDFRPSPTANLNLGIRYLTDGILTPQLQLNARWDGRERGDQADTPNSGGEFLFLSPGVTAELGRRTSSFLILQLPVYQRVNGLQLEPSWLLSLGVRVAL